MLTTGAAQQKNRSYLIPRPNTSRIQTNETFFFAICSAQLDRICIEHIGV
jgi:hypothetical protein